MYIKMADNNSMKKRKTIRKTGKTIILRSEQDFTPSDMIGLVSHIKVNDEKHFLVFDSIDNSKEAFKTLRTDSKLSVRFAYYRVFFKMSGLDENSDYTQIKKEHSEWLVANSGANILYYKQYKKDGKLIGCGDFTVDTKDSMDKLLNKDELKTYSFGAYSGTYYRYNKKTDQTFQIMK